MIIFLSIVGTIVLLCMLALLFLVSPVGYTLLEKVIYNYSLTEEQKELFNRIKKSLTESPDTWVWDFHKYSASHGMCNTISVSLEENKSYIRISLSAGYYVDFPEGFVKWFMDIVDKEKVRKHTTVLHRHLKDLDKI